MNLIKKINNYWTYLEAKYPVPKYVEKVNVLNFLKLKKEIDNKNEKFIKIICYFIILHYVLHLRKL